MAQMYESWTTRLYGRGRLVPVEPWVRGPEGFSETELADFFEPFLEDNRWGGTLVTMPFNKSAYLLQYNVDLLRRAGFDEAPATWEEMREAAGAVSRLTTEDGRACRGFMIRPGLEAFATIFFSAGGEFLDEAGRPMMTSGTARESLSLLVGMLDEGSAFVDRNFPSAVLGSGALGMYIHSSASFPFNDRLAEGKFEWRAAPVPRPGGTAESDRRTLFQGYNVGLLAGHPEEVTAAAWGFLRYMLQPGQVARWSRQTGYCPLRRTAVESEVYREFLTGNAAYGVPLAVVHEARFEPKPDYWESWRTSVNDVLAAGLQRISTVEETLLAAQRAGEEALRYDSKFPAHAIGMPTKGEVAGQGRSGTGFARPDPPLSQ
jgi:multiple sugar transport system substrate-binding protein